MKKQLIRAAATTVLALSLTTGFAAAATGDISNTGPRSENRVTSSVDQTTRVTNRNTVRATNQNMQHSYTGDATVRHNTTGGDATSGSAMNDNSLDAAVSIDNSSSAGMYGGGSGGGNSSGTIHTTGPDSENVIRSTVNTTTTVNNTNNLTVTNHSDQHASSGDATVSGNTTGGSATTGDASNVNSSSFDLSVSN